MAQADSKNSITASVDPTRRFETLKDAEDALMEQGFKLVPNTCNWIDDDGNDAGAYPVEEAYGVSKYRIEYRRQVFPVGPTRRHFLSQAAGVAAGGTVLALATIQPMTAASEPVAVLPNDSALLKLEEQIFEQYEGATAYDDEIGRLHDIWTGELKRLAVEGYAGRSTLTRDQQWNMVCEMPESIECARLVNLQDPFFRKMDALIKEMFAIPARTPDGRRAKAVVLISCIMGPDWRHVDKETDYPEEMARKLLIEFIGGEPGEMLRDQFA